MAAAGVDAVAGRVAAVIPSVRMVAGTATLVCALLISTVDPAARGATTQPSRPPGPLSPQAAMASFELEPGLAVLLAGLAFNVLPALVNGALATTVLPSSGRAIADP